MKTCTKCRAPKNLNSFNLSRRRKDGLNTICRTCSNERSKAYYDRNRQSHKKTVAVRKIFLRKQAKDLVNMLKLSNPCPCGEHEPAALDFHHKDPTTKDLNVGKLCNGGHSLSQIQAEIAKCIVMCSNCHRKYHAGVKLSWEMKILTFNAPGVIL